VHGDLETRQSEAVAVQVREELARRRLSRQWLADEARVSVSTIEKALAGRRPFTLPTVVRLEEALGLKLRRPEPAVATPAATGLAPEEYGAYSRAAVSWLEGDYLTLRPSFSDPDAIYAYRTLIEWNDERSHLCFHEAARKDAEFSQSGSVSFPHVSGHVYLVTVELGQYRLAIFGRPTITAEMNGVLTTLISGAGSQLTPAAAPIALVPMRHNADPEFGVLKQGQRCFGDYRQRLDRITREKFARLLT
jgi:transcriptional regulator with XRE-family HTH domain